MASAPFPADRAPLRIALVDDHAMFRTALEDMILNRVPGYTVELRAANGKELVGALEGGASVDLAIIDLDMPVMNGFETLEWLGQHRPGIRSLVLSFDASVEALARSMKAGACGHLPKDAEPEEFKLALDRISREGHYHNEALQQKLAEHAAVRELEANEAGSVRARLTSREMEIIRLSCAPEEYTYKEIAARLDLLPSTVESHRKRIFQKFNIKSKAGLVQFAFKWGIAKG